MPVELTQSTATASSSSLLWLFFYASFTLLTPPLLDDADSVHAEVAREMLLRHDWVTLYANGIRYLEKAPLLYWSMAASFKLFGVRTAAAAPPPRPHRPRARPRRSKPSPAEPSHSTRAGLYAALITALQLRHLHLHPHHHPRRDGLPLAHPRPLLLLAHRTAERVTDPPHQTKDVSSRPQRSGVEGPASLPRYSEPAPSRLLCYGFAACCALNVLTKGLIGIVFPIGIVAHPPRSLTRGWRGAITRIRQLHPITSTARLPR